MSDFNRIIGYTKLLTVRKPTRKEKKDNGAEVVFEREEQGTGRKYVIYGAVLYESWEQWGAPVDVLSDNVMTIERWRKEKDKL